jgi:hypothetical protein
MNKKSIKRHPASNEKLKVVSPATIYCCDCGLAHRVIQGIDKEGLFVQYSRDEEKTKKYRIELFDAGKWRFKRKKRGLGGDIPCADCGTRINPVWFTGNEFWNDVMGKNERVKILCPYCFIFRAEKVYRITGWKITPELK